MIEVSKLVVYTTVLGGEEEYELHDPSVMERGVDYVCFTDNKDLKSDRWHIKYVSPTDDPRTESRRYKSKPWEFFPDKFYSVWVDTRFVWMCKPSPCVEHWLERWDMAALRHPHRQNIDEEAIAIADRGLLPLELLQAQAKRYRDEGFVFNDVITSTGVCLRRHTPGVMQFGQAWWKEISEVGYRDQMSVDYCAWKTGLKIGYMAGHYRENPYCQWIK